MDYQQLQEEKARLEIEKLNAELRNLRRPFWLSQGHYLLALSGVAALLVGINQVQKTNHEFRLAELRKTQIEAETKKLERERAQNESEIAALRSHRQALMEENSKLGTQLAELSRYISRNQPIADEFNKQLATIRSKIFPLDIPVPWWFEIGTGVTTNTQMKLSQDGKFVANITISGAYSSRKEIRLPGYRVTVFDINSEVPIHQFSFPSRVFRGKPFEPTQLPSKDSQSTNIYSYNINQSLEYNLPLEIVNKVFLTSQIRVEEESAANPPSSS